ncbi:pyruvate kinase [Holotrichia oblita]|nr:pyruvate kinase [Holotrichia oblita]
MKTKIICTIGPACESEEMLGKLIAAGMSVARVNCSHSSVEANEATIERLKKVRKDLGVPLAIMLDTKGPDIRIGKFAEGSVMLAESAKFTFTTRQCEGDINQVFVDCKKLPKALTKGQVFLLNDGFIKMTVRETTDTDIICNVDVGGRLSDRKSLYAPGAEIGMPFLSKADEDDLLMGIRADVDYIAASFVSSAKDVSDMKKFLVKNGGNIPVIAKIESRGGVTDIDEILKVCDGIMTARGDLGVEYPIEQIPTVQKILTKKAVEAGKLIITATEMLESMIEKPRPTRAETTDIANAIYDGTSCIMLSGETAVGKYPVQAVNFMKRIAEEAEKNIAYETEFNRGTVAVNGLKEAFAKTTTSAALSARAKAIVVFTESGGTAVRVAKFHPACNIYAHARTEKVFHQMAMFNSITPIYLNTMLTVSQMLKISNDYVLDNKIAKKGEIIVINASYQDTDTDLVLIHPLA